MNNTNLDSLFFGNNGLDKHTAEKITAEAVSGAEDGELYMQSSQSESFSFDDGKLKVANSNSDLGFGLRSLSGDIIGYAHASEISKESLERAAKTVKTVRSKNAKEIDVSPAKTNKKYYKDINPLSDYTFEQKVKLLQTIDSYARNKNNKVEQVSISLASSWEAIRILRADGQMIDEIRPLVRLG